ncbi:MAG: YSC84-related protein [Deferrisomatales bacterium]|nr:YSC84-related protein [Deferrisomatales bacterium]
MNRSLVRWKAVLAGAIGLLALGALGACATAPRSVEGKADIEKDAAVALAKAQKTDPTLVNIFNKSAGYAVFPSVGKAGAGVGGAYGKGVLYEGGVVVGYCDLSQATLGLQLGAQSYTQIIAFETTEAVETFKQGRFGFDAQATAVGLKSGVGANTQFNNGVAVFVMDEAGLMLEASVGGQKFSYQGK